MKTTVVNLFLPGADEPSSAMSFRKCVPVDEDVTRYVSSSSDEHSILQRSTIVYEVTENVKGL
jgi:hypothetical protein